MPHSSGGGHSHSSHSHSGSHRSSSHSSSGSGSIRSSAPVVLYSPCVGYSRYAYYRNGDSKVYYKYVKNKAGIPAAAVVFFSFVYLIFLFAAIGLIAASVSVRKPLKLDYNDEIVIEDNIGRMNASEKADLTEAFEEFKTKTGVTMSFITVYDDRWSYEKDTLEDYAYYLYVNRFNDEKHWLIVYSENNGSADWQWEGMQGDDTDTVLSKAVSVFNESYQKYLFSDSKYDYAMALTAAMNDINNLKYSGIKVEPTIGIGIFILAFIILHAWLMFSGMIKSSKEDEVRIKKEKAGAVRVDEGAKEDVCEYCGGVYIHGVHTSCPHCAAPVRAQQGY